ncbi:MAG: hypothetical protein K8J31_13735 [Anaerolineae bacterium]|nr:hypothetical protein [Anaerolineae bacterium]
MYHSIVKPHYRLLGMLLERRELHHQVAMRATRVVRSRQDGKLDELEHQLGQLDHEIRVLQSQVWQTFAAEGRNADELRAFIGEDLMEELLAARAKKPRGLVS